MNTVIALALVGGAVLAQQTDLVVPHCTGHCTESPEPAKDGEAEGTVIYPARWTEVDVLRAMSTASPRAQCIVRSEVGGVGFSPWAVGAAGELGPTQLHPRGLLVDYGRWSGGRAPEDPYWSIRYLDYMLASGRGGNWSAVSAGRC